MVSILPHISATHVVFNGQHTASHVSVTDVVVVHKHCTLEILLSRCGRGPQTLYFKDTPAVDVVVVHKHCTLEILLQ